MTRYDNSKIYKIQGGSMTYIGSTTKQYLSQRWAGHTYDYKNKERRTTAWAIFDAVGIDNCSISLIETYPCKSIDELRARERYWIEKEECVNRCLPGQTKQEWTEKYKPKRDALNATTFTCECGSTYTYGNKSRHLKSKAHEANLLHC